MLLTKIIVISCGNETRGIYEWGILLHDDTFLEITVNLIFLAAFSNHVMFNLFT
jgi:hypothetical protein